MSNILIFGFNCEGTTDKRFLESIIQKTFEEIALECPQDIDVYPVNYITVPSNNIGFIEKTKLLAKKAFDTGIQILCIHTDADANTNDFMLQNKIIPTLNAINAIENNICKNIVPIIPIHMSEAWMLADKELLKEEINTTKTDIELNIAKPPEGIADPKETIENAINIAQRDIPNKIHKITISDLYQPIGQNISLNSLKELQSYIIFRESVILAFKKLNYIR